MPIPATPPETVQGIREDYAAGVSPREIAKNRGVSYPTIYKYVADIPRQRTRRRSAAIAAEVEALDAQGLTTEQVAEAAGVNVRTVQRLRKERKPEVRPEPSPTF